MRLNRRRRAFAITAATASAILTSLTLSSSRSQAAPSGAAITVPPITVVVNNAATNPAQVTGTVKVGNLPATQPVSGSVSVSNLPATQPVSGTVTVGNLPDVQKVEVTNFPTGTGGASGTVAVSNFPATQQVAGTVAVGNLPDVQTVKGSGISGTLNVSEASTNAFTRLGDCGSSEAVISKSCDPMWSGPSRTSVAISLSVPAGVTPLAYISVTASSQTASTWVPLQRASTMYGRDWYVGRITDVYLQLDASVRALVMFDTPTTFTGSVLVDGIYLGS